MPFIQRKLDRSINQSRGIFDKYVYKTDDLISEVSSSGYFAKSRFSSDTEWVDSVIECECSDGYIFGAIQSDGTLNVFFDSNSGGSSMPFAPSGSDFYVAEGSSWFVASSVLKADREVVVRGTDTSSQNPIGTDTPLQVTFGPAVGTGTDAVQILADGTIRINEADNYHFRLSSQYGRSGSGGTAWIWQRVLVNGVQAGVSVLAKLNNSSSDFPYQAELTATLPAGVDVTVELWRDSVGADDGGFIFESPTLVGANDGYSADVIVSRYVLKNK